MHLEDFRGHRWVWKNFSDTDTLSDCVIADAKNWSCKQRNGIDDDTSLSDGGDWSYATQIGFYVHKWFLAE